MHCDVLFVEVSCELVDEGIYGMTRKFAELLGMRAPASVCRAARDRWAADSGHPLQLEERAGCAQGREIVMALQPGHVKALLQTTNFLLRHIILIDYDMLRVSGTVGVTRLTSKY